MHTIDLDAIIIGMRIRPCLHENVVTMARDIKEKGLLQPIVLLTHENPKLLCGEHRIKALRLIEHEAEELGTEGSYRHNGFTFDCSQIPYVIVGELTPQQMIEYEIAENLIRVQLTWQERTQALAKLADLNPSNQASNVARELVSGGDKRSPTAIMTEVSKAMIVAEHLDDPDVAKARTVTEAWTVVRKKAGALTRTLLSDAEEAVTHFESPHTLIHGDMTHVLPRLPFGTFDLIIADPPYGSGADTWTSKFIDTPHDYKDDLPNATRLTHSILYNGLRLLKERGNLFFFCDPKYWSKWEEMARNIGWATWPRPLMWKKSGEGIRPWGTAGFAYTYETILYATKGRKGLLKSVNDVIEIYKVTSGRLHGAQKPAELYSFLMDISSLPGDTVLDPTCGSGTVFESAHTSRLIATGIEANEEYHAIAEERRQATAKPIILEADFIDDLEGI